MNETPKGASLKILALVKYSLDSAEIRVDATTHALRLAGVPERFGDLDKGAVEVAVRLKEAHDATVEVLCLGPAAARRSAKDVLAMGADEATVIEDPFEGAAEAAVAVRVLEAAIRKRGPFDLILCGFASDDGYSHQTGPRLAERLSLPFVSYVSEISLEGATLLADRDLEDGTQAVSVALPAIVSVAEEAFVPRRVTLLQAMKAQKKPLNAWTLEEDLDLSKQTLDGLASSTLVSEAGVVVDRKRQIIQDSDLAGVADRFIDALVADGVLLTEGGA
jgi:electron transfer flavoprotein alpha/beta subunit